MPDPTPLASLKDLHLPAPVSWWPLAPGWLILLIVLIVVGLSVATWFYVRWRRYYHRRVALRTLAQLKQHYIATRDVDCVSQASVLLRRMCLRYYSRTVVAGLFGLEWLAFLDKTGNTTVFTQGVGHYLLTVPYQPVCENDVTTLFDILEQWIKHKR